MNATSHASTLNPRKEKVSRGRRPNAHYRAREYLTEREIERLMKVAGDNRHGHRDADHDPAGLPPRSASLRAAGSLRWEQVDLVHGRLHVSRAKNGRPVGRALTPSPARSPGR